MGNCIMPASVRCTGVVACSQTPATKQMLLVRTQALAPGTAAPSEGFPWQLITGQMGVRAAVCGPGSLEQGCFFPPSSLLYTVLHALMERERTCVAGLLSGTSLWPVVTRFHMESCFPRAWKRSGLTAAVVSALKRRRALQTESFKNHWRAFRDENRLVSCSELHSDSGSSDLAGGRVVKGWGEVLYEIKGGGTLDALYFFPCRHCRAG